MLLRTRVAPLFIACDARWCGRPEGPSSAVDVKYCLLTWSTSISIADLDRIAYEVTELRGAVKDGQLIFMTEPDELNNRIIVTLSEMSDSLMWTLSSRFGAESVAVRVDPAVAFMTTSSNRQSDNSPFYGGADIRLQGHECTSGFPWRNGSLWQGMLTAGHCGPHPETVVNEVKSGSGDMMGSVLYENWNSNTGTVSWPGEPGVYRGDLALVRIAYNESVLPRIWRGGSSGTTSSTVKIVWQRWSRPGDDVCSGGQKTGDICYYDVKKVGIHAWYSDDGTFARNVVEAHKSGSCHIDGDSGAPIWTPYPGGVAAKGILSGGGSIFGTCYLYYTDIQHADQTLPGGTWASP